MTGGRKSHGVMKRGFWKAFLRNQSWHVRTGASSSALPQGLWWLFITALVLNETMEALRSFSSRRRGRNGKANSDSYLLQVDTAPPVVSGDHTSGTLSVDNRQTNRHHCG